MTSGRRSPQSDPGAREWRPLSERSAAELRAQAEEYRRMAATASTEQVMRSLRDMADRFDRMADQREQAAPRRND
jgi:hypothetical protein